MLGNIAQLRRNWSRFDNRQLGAHHSFHHCTTAPLHHCTTAQAPKLVGWTESLEKKFFADELKRQQKISEEQTMKAWFSSQSVQNITAVSVGVVRGFIPNLTPPSFYQSRCRRSRRFKAGAMGAAS
jgi:hypothetical protein